MFWASLCPSSGALDRTLLHMVFSIGCAGWSLHSAHGLLPGSPRFQPAYAVLKTICSNILSTSPEDGHNDARNMLS